MILEKVGKAMRAQINRLANYYWTKDPVAQLRLDYDRAVLQMKQGRQGLEQVRALVQRVERQVASNEKQSKDLTAKIKAFLEVGDRRTAGQLAIQRTRLNEELAENQQQLKLHQGSYDGQLSRIKQAAGELASVRLKIRHYEADLKMTEAEAELATLSQTLEFDVTTDFGELEQVVGQTIASNRARMRVTTDLSADADAAEVKLEQVLQEPLAEKLLAELEAEIGLAAGSKARVEPIATVAGASRPPLEETPS